MERATGACGEGCIDDRLTAACLAGPSIVSCFQQFLASFGLIEVACSNKPSRRVSGSVELLGETGSFGVSGTFTHALHERLQKCLRPAG